MLKNVKIKSESFPFIDYYTYSNQCLIANNFIF